MPPTFFIVMFLAVYIPGLALILLLALGLHISKDRTKFALPLFLSYLVFPLSQIVAALVTIPMFLGCIYAIHLAQTNLSDTGVSYTSIIGVSITGMFFVTASYQSAKRVCSKVWYWSISRWPNGFTK